MKSSFIFFSTQKHWVLTHSFMILIWSGKIKNKYLLICLEFCKILTGKDDCDDTKKFLQKTIFWNHISRLLYLSSNDALSWNGFDFITLFCCLFATTSIVTSINMLRTYNELKKLANLIENLPDDEDSLDDKRTKRKALIASANRIGLVLVFIA